MNPALLKSWSTPARALWLALLLSLTPLGVPTAVAQSDLSPRMRIGVNLLPAVIAANKNLRAQLNQQNKITVYLVFRSNPALAKSIARQLSSKPRILGHPTEYIIMSSQELLTSAPLTTNILFIVEPLANDLNAVLDFARKHRLLSFSPFKGDVEKGISTGFRVTDKVLPLVNLKSLRHSRIQLKAFFLRIAVKYE